MDDVSRRVTAEGSQMSESMIASTPGPVETTNGVLEGVPLAKRDRPRGMLPSTWLNRSLRIEYTDCYGAGQETSGVYLDHCAAGVILNIRGARTLISWDRIGLLELTAG